MSNRQGCDATPLDPTSSEGRLALLAYTWPDQKERVARMQAAIEMAGEVPISVDHEKAAPWAARKLSERTPGTATVLCHSIFSQYMSRAERSDFHSHIEEAAARATAEAPLAWLRMEHAGKRAELRLNGWPGGEERLLARVGYHGTPVEVTAQGP